MPDIFRGIHLDPLVPANSFYLLWMILGYLVVTSVLIVSLGRLGDMVGRVQIYNLGFVIYTVASLMLAIDWLTGRGGRDVPDRASASCRASAARACWPTRPRSSPTRSPPTSAGWRSGSTTSSASAACSSGSCSAACSRRSTGGSSSSSRCPVGLFGTVWAYLRLRGAAARRSRAPIDWAGNVTFALGLVLVMVAVTYGIRPDGGHADGLGRARA